MHAKIMRPLAMFGIAALMLLSLLQPLARHTALAQSHTLRALTHSAPYSIALANSYIGNTWRVEMESEFRGACAMPPLKAVVKCTAYNSGNDVAKQTQQIDNLISSHVDAILIDAASTTGLNGVIAQACSAGILVVSFDNQVTAPCALQINTDEVAFGKQGATFLVNAMGGKGNVVMVTGVPGAPADTQRNTGAMSVFSAHPGIKVISRFAGMWASDVAQRNTASALPSLGKVDGLWVQGGTDGVIRSLLAAHRPLVPVAGEAENGFREDMLKYKSQGFKAISIGQPPFVSLVSLQLAVEVLQGKRPKGNVNVPFPFVTTDTVKEGVTAFKNLPDSFFDDFTDSGPKATVVICVTAATKGTPCPGSIAIHLPK
ncbi:MAG: monosaccharide transporter substrate-binding protein family [Chloroflexi bacterium]|nr:monosaccharide transporter substrate-binding protein family [Chloroflexota bacterium]